MACVWPLPSSLWERACAWRANLLLFQHPAAHFAPNSRRKGAADPAHTRTLSVVPGKNYIRKEMGRRPGIQAQNATAAICSLFPIFFCFLPLSCQRVFSAMATRAKKPPLRKREQANVRTVSRQAVNSMAFQESRRSAASLARAKSGRGEPRERTRKRKGWNRVSEEKRVVVGRSHLVGKRVITLNSAQDLGEVAQLWVDPEEWTVVALSIRTSFLFGALDHLPISSLQQVRLHPSSSLRPCPLHHGGARAE